MVARSVALAGSSVDRLLEALIALLLVGGLLLPLARTTAQTGGPVLLNEALVSHTGIDTTEFVELYGTPGQPLGGLSIVVVDGDSTTAGKVEVRVDLPGDARLGGNGFYLVGNPAGLSSAYGVAPDLALPSNDFIGNGSQTVGLVHTATLGPVGSTVTGSEDVLDALGLSDGGASDHWYWSPPVVGPDPDGFAAAGAHRKADGVDTDVPADWGLADYYLNSTSSPNTPTPATPYVEPTPAPTPTPVPTATPVPTPVPAPVPPDSTPDAAALLAMFDACVDNGDVAAAQARQLRNHLVRAERFAADGHPAAAMAQLQAFSNQLAGLVPRWVDPAAADQLAAVTAALAADMRLR